jgi:DNA-nicking Smr family endonuclease
MTRCRVERGYRLQEGTGIVARRKRRNRLPPPPPSRREEPFHAPFHALKESLQQVSGPPASTSVPLAATTAPKEAEPCRLHEQQERALFLAAMADVERLTPDAHGRVEKRRQPLHSASLTPDEDVGLADLRDFVEGRSAFTIQYTDEYMEGIAPGVDWRLAQRLHRGAYTIQAQLDLHGYTVEEAKVLVHHFLTNAYTMGRRCVRLIHGRGHNSADNRPVLKEYVQTWLSQGRLSRLVLAFVTAPVHDGGAGAVYVLLRRATRTK